MKSYQTKLLKKRQVGPFHYVLTFEKKDLTFQSGQYIHLGTKQNMNRREYSIYSAQEDQTLEILLSLQPLGEVSPLLCRCKPGDLLEMEGPFGRFILTEEEKKQKIYMIATGTGLSPFNSLSQSHSDLDYTIIHGIRSLKERMEWEHYPSRQYISCTSRSNEGNHRGRVTSYISSLELQTSSIFMLCGNSDMIYQCHDILRKKGVSSENIRAEIYF